jgi:hypothetical protein
MMMRIAFCAATLALGIAAASAQSSEAYVNQVDRSSGGDVLAPSTSGMQGSAYIIQVPESARPTPPRAPSRRADPTPRQASTAAVEPVGRSVLPSIGSGVTLALSNASTIRSFPDVGAGVGAP